MEEHLESFASKENEPLIFEKLFLGDYEINHCKGCRACMDVGEQFCSWKDDIPLIKEKMKNADAIIFASPVFVGDVSSSMKALIDRLAYICHRQEFYDKCSVIIATTNATSLKRTIHTIGAASYSWGMKNLATGGFKTATSNDSKEALKKNYDKKIKKIAKKCYFGVKNKEFLSPSLVSLITFNIQQKHRANPELSSKIDYNYWKARGWTEPTKKFYLDVNTNFGKYYMSKLLSKVINLFF